MHTDQEPHFIVIGTIYFMSHCLYFLVPPILILYLSALLKSECELQGLVTAKSAAVTYWIRVWLPTSKRHPGCGAGTWLIRHYLPYFNLQHCACQHDNVICSPVFLPQPLHDSWSLPTENEMFPCSKFVWYSVPISLCTDTYFSSSVALQRSVMWHGKHDGSLHKNTRDGRWPGQRQLSKVFLGQWPPRLVHKG